MTASLHSGRLTSSDASFLYLERREAPMHIGAVAILAGELPFADYVQTVGAKLGRLPRFRERVMAAPFNLGHPTWETDPGFDIANHIKLHRADAPGGDAELRALAAKLIEGTMDRSRPLWELHIVHGLAAGRSAIVSKVHHAMVDGVGGNQILTTILDLSREAATPEPVAYTPTVGMDPGRRVSEALWDATRGRIEAWSEYLRALTDLGRQFDLERARTTTAVLGELMPELALPPRRLPFNRACKGERRLAWTQVSFAEARAIRGALGGTVNDVILAALGGAVGRYAQAHGEKVAGRNMRVMCPVNVRRDEDHGALGNQVSVLPIPIPLDVEDPGTRLRAVRETTRALKAARVADGVGLMVTLMGVVPAPLQAAFGAVAISPTPLFNLVCTNVPGPQIPLYAEGLALHSYYPYIPVGFEMGLGCAIFSYNQRLYFGLTADVAACPDVERLRELLDQAFAELKAAAGVGEIDVVPTKTAAQPAAGAEAEPRPVRRRAAGGRAAPQPAIERSVTS